MDEKPTYQELEDKIERLTQNFRKKDSELREIQELAKIGNWEWDLQRNVLRWSDQVYQIFGLEPGDSRLSVEYFEATIHSEDREDFFRQREMMFQQRKPLCIDHRIVLPDGSVRYVQERAQLFLNGTNNLYRMIGTVQDVTERKRLEKQLHLFKAIVENSNEAIAISDTEGKMIYINPAHEKLLGYPLTESQKLNYRRFYPQESIEILNTVVVPAIKRGESWEGVIDAFDANGRRFPLWERTGTLMDGEGKMLYGFGFMHDDTERIQLERQRHILHKVESIHRMAGAIAHLYNNLLWAVTGNLEMAIDDLQENERALHLLNEAGQAAKKAAEISGLMLTYIGHTHAKQELLDLSDACAAFLPFFKKTIQQNVMVKIDLQTPGPAIQGNAKQIQQVLKNLLLNGAEAIGDGSGSLHLTIRTDSFADISLTHLFPIDGRPRDGEYAVIEVKDTGCGIPDQDIDQIFDPFYSSKFTGRGLGLPVALGLVQAHHGFITVESQPEEGSTFRGFFPLANRSFPRKTEPEA